MYDHEKNIIVKHLAGSRAYGTNLPGSDYDYRGIFIADKEFILTPFYKVDEFSDGNEEDTKFYEMNNYMKLCLDANPNIMESLWVDQNDVIYHTEYYQMLRDNRESFLSSKVAFTYTGYAHNQFTRMDNHHSWIDRERNGITKLQETIDMCRCSQVKDFIYNNFHDHIINLLDLSDCNEMVRSPMHLAYERLFKDQSIQLLMKNNIAQKYFIKLVHNYMPEKILENTFDISHYNDGYALISYGSNIYAVLERSGSRTLNSNGSLYVSDHSGLSLEEIKQSPCMIVKFNKDEYEKANSQRNNYQTWKTNRNEARAELEKMSGYDCYLDKETEFLTRDGFKKYDEIDDSDELGTINPKTHVIEFQHFFDRVKKNYSGDIYIGENDNTSFSVTGNHRMFTSRCHRSKRGTKYEKNDSLWEFSSMESLIDSKYSYYHTLQSGINNNPDYDITDDMLILIGSYLSEGSIIEYKGKSNRVKGISISQLDGNRLCKWMDKITEFNVFNYQHERKGRLENTYNIYNQQLAESIYDWCGRYEKTKKMIPFVTLLSKRQATLLYDVMMAGDGTHRKYSDIYYTSSKELTSGFQVLCIMSGRVSKIYNYLGKFSTNQIYSRDYNDKPSVLITSNHVKINHVENEHVVCFSVPNETLITRRNNKIAFHGNTKHAMHTIRLLNTASEILQYGEVFVKRPDAKELLDIRDGNYSYDEITKMYQEKSTEIREVLYNSTTLPKKPDLKKASQVLIDVREMYWYGKQ